MTPSKKVLVVEDEIAIRDMLRFALQASGFEVSELDSAQNVVSVAQSVQPDVILMDWMLPDISGIQAIEALRKSSPTQRIPIIMLTAKGDEQDQVRGLDSGADDYVVKPFSPRALMSRINAVLRRQSSASPDETTSPESELEQGRIKIDFMGHRVLIDGEEIKLGPKEFQILTYMMKRPDRVFSRAQLLEQVWDSGVIVEDRTVDVHIRRLRKQLEVMGVQDYIQTVRGAGYRFSVIEE